MRHDHNFEARRDDIVCAAGIAAWDSWPRGSSAGDRRSRGERVADVWARSGRHALLPLTQITPANVAQLQARGSTT
jgi:hypothetical protein